MIKNETELDPRGPEELRCQRAVEGPPADVRGGGGDQTGLLHQGDIKTA